MTLATAYHECKIGAASDEFGEFLSLTMNTVQKIWQGFKDVLIRPSTYIALMIGLVLLGIRFDDSPVIEGVRMRLFDSYQKLWPREDDNPPVIIADIDEKSLEVIGQWPWSRTIIAELVTELKEMGAVVIGFDIVFAEADRMSPSAFARGTKNLPAEIADALAEMPDNDRILSKAFVRAPVIAGQATSNDERYRLNGEKIRQPQPARLGGDPLPFLPQAEGLIRNVLPLEKSARGKGIFSLDVERDGIIRRVPTLFAIDGKLYPSLPIEMLRVAARGKNYAVQAYQERGGGISRVQTAGIWIPTDRRGRMWIKFRKWNASTHLSISDILSRDIPPERVRGKIVIVGTSAIGLLDIKRTPLNDQIPGVDVHAQALENILAQDFLVRPLVLEAIELLSVALAVLGFVLVIPLLGPLWTLLIYGAVSVSYVATSIYLFREHGWLLDATYPVFAALILFSYLTFANFAREERQRRQIRHAFSHYLSPDMVDELTKDPDRLKLGGEAREMTILFSDIQGFTGLSEKYDAATLTTIINKLLTPLSNEILEGKGTIDKFMGDCIMAFWNAPLQDPNHARDACHVALKMAAAMDPINKRLQAEMEEEGHEFNGVKVGIGINTGIVCVGNVGSDQRFEYSVLGDDVNLASRLEGQTRTYRIDIVIGEATAKQVPEMAHVELDLIIVKGKTKPVRIFALVGDQDIASDIRFKELKSHHDLMVASYRTQDWEVARQAIKAGFEAAEEFGISNLYLMYNARIEEYEAFPPGDDWDGVYRATTK